jgi:hypothetical protein
VAKVILKTKYFEQRMVVHILREIIVGLAYYYQGP